MEDHGPGHDMMMHNHSSTMLQDISPFPLTYYTTPEYQAWLVAHVSLMVVAWVVILPLGVMLGISRSKLHVPFQVLFLALVASGAICATVYNHATPDLYPNNAHHKIGWIIIWTLLAQLVMGASRAIFAKSSMNRAKDYFIHHLRYSLLQHSNHNHVDADEEPLVSPATTAVDSPSRPSVAEGEFEKHAHHKLQRWIGGATFVRVARVAHSAVGRAMLPFGFVQLCTGIITATGLGIGHEVFGLLAHAIKGGIFFWYGIYSLGRWLGAFAEIGWAWNMKPAPQLVGGWTKRAPSAEAVESGLIFMYGFLSMFMEHLGNTDGVWSHKDLQHLSIAFLFLGGGTCGLFIESGVVKKLLNRPISQAVSTEPSLAEEPQNLPPESYNYSFNPMSALVVFITGLMMSSHHQDTVLATTIHKQWGLLLALASVFRLLTYTLFFLAPPKSIYPSRPPTELLTAFCLISGGLVFILSNAETVDSLERRGIGAMFPFMCSLAGTMMLMAWISLVKMVGAAAYRRSA